MTGAWVALGFEVLAASASRVRKQYRVADSFWGLYLDLWFSSLVWNVTFEDALTTDVADGHGSPKHALISLYRTVSSTFLAEKS